MEIPGRRTEKESTLLDDMKLHTQPVLSNHELAGFSLILVVIVEKHKSQTRSSIEAPQLVPCVLGTHLLGPTALQMSLGSLSASGSRVADKRGSLVSERGKDHEPRRG